MRKLFEQEDLTKTIPATEIRANCFSLFGHEIVDNYAWLKADNWREVLQDPEQLPSDIRMQLQNENNYLEKILHKSKNLRTSLQNELRARIKEEDSSVPERDGHYSYFTRFTEGAQHGQFWRIDRCTGLETLLLDADRAAKGKAYFDLGEAEPSPDHTILAWSADTNGSEYYTIRIRDLNTNRDRKENLKKTSGDIVWMGDSSGFYYIELDAMHRPVRVRRHLLGAPPAQDEIIYEERDAGFFLSLAKTQSGAYVVIGAHDHETSEAWLLDAGDPQAKPQLVEGRHHGILYEVEHWNDSLVILTNADGAEDFKIVSASPASPRRAGWTDLIAHRPGIMILDTLPLKGHLIRLERENAKPRIVIREAATGQEHEIAFTDDAYALGIEAGREYETETLRFVYSSMRHPAEVYDYDCATRSRLLRKRQEIPSGHNPDDYTVTRLFAPARDGEMVPISLVHRNDVTLDGSAPCLLYGYGSYGHAIAAGFKTDPLSLIDRGFVYAIAHVRGGTEKGWRWYQDGKREKKINTFTDFIACAEHLIAKGYTGRGRIVAHGGSAGGMLMGAVANMAPELFAGIIAEVPFVDVLNTMLDADLPLTPPEWPEWGNPAASEAEFTTLRSYSPYDNIRAQDYPAILALGGLTDPRVTYWEPAKWVAKLRATMTGGGPVLLHTNMDAGHGGASGRFDRLKEVALAYAFALDAVAPDSFA